ncbi:MAG: hypothetical protein V1858_03215 [Candidatus Gottesmanbacteria bacterium]
MDNLKRFFLKPPYTFYEKFIKRQKEGLSFIILFFFLITFILARTWVYLSIIGLIPESLTENIRGVHIHHFAWGILLNSIIGYLVLVLPRHYFEVWKTKLSALFGIGLALTFDEFGMWLRLQDNYVFRHGYDVIIIITLLFLNIIYFSNLWKRIGSLIYRDIMRIKIPKFFRSLLG